MSSPAHLGVIFDSWNSYLPSTGTPHLVHLGDRLANFGGRFEPSDPVFRSMAGRGAIVDIVGAAKRIHQKGILDADPGGRLPLDYLFLGRMHTLRHGAAWTHKPSATPTSSGSPWQRDTAASLLRRDAACRPYPGDHWEAQSLASGWNRKQVELPLWVMSTHSAQDPRMSVHGRSSDMGFRVPLIFI